MLAAIVLSIAALLVPSPGFADGTAGSAQSVKDKPRTPTNKDRIPKLFKLNAHRAEAIADSDKRVKNYLRRFKSSKRVATVEGQGKWQVSYYVGANEVAQVKIDDSLAVVEEAWIGPQVAWTMARGTEGAFGRKVNELWVWIPLMIVFIIPFVQIRRPFSLLNLDLAVLLSFSVSHYYFNQGEIFTSVPLVYPPLVYLLLRMLMAGYSRAKRSSGRVPELLVPVSWLALGLVFLVGFRIMLNVLDSNVIDVGYSGVIGAERWSSGESLYGNFPSDNGSGDTYGPFAYLAYIPFELLLPWGGSWDSLPAAHAASIFFDLAMILGLYLLGVRLSGMLKPAGVRPVHDLPHVKTGRWIRLQRARGLLGDGRNRLGLALAFAWAAYPYTLYVMNSNTNDTLMPMLLVFGFLALTSAPARGALLALASFTKFAAAALAPLWLSYRDPDSSPLFRLKFLLAFLVVSAVIMTPVLIDSGLSLFWERTIAFQLGRESPFSIWGLHPVRYGAAQDVLKVLVALFAVAVAFVPKSKDPIRLAALTAAVLIALQLVTTHWFYLYIVWFFPFVLIALLGRLGPRPQFCKEPDDSVA